MSNKRRSGASQQNASAHPGCSVNLPMQGARPKVTTKSVMYEEDSVHPELVNKYRSEVEMAGTGGQERKRCQLRVLNLDKEPLNYRTGTAVGGSTKVILSLALTEVVMPVLMSSGLKEVIIAIILKVSKTVI